MHNERLGDHSMERSVRATKDRIVIGSGRLQHDGHRHAVKKPRMERLDLMLPLECSVGLFDIGPQLCFGLFQSRRGLGRRTGGAEK